MKIDRKLNLVLPVNTDTGLLYVHSAPIGREVFERYHAVIGKTFAEIFGGGYGALVGPRMAAMILRDKAEQSGAWGGDTGVERGLMAEIIRLSNVSVPGEKGWEMVMLDDAIRGGNIFTLDEVSEVVNTLVFFTVVSSVLKKDDPTMGAGLRLWGARTESLDYTAFHKSLPTLTPAGSTGANAPAPVAPASFIPS